MVCRPRKKGGLDFKELLSWNKALLSGYIITLAQPHSDLESLWVQWIRKHKLNNGAIWDCERKESDSAFWKELLALHNELLTYASASQLTDATTNMVYECM